MNTFFSVLILLSFMALFIFLMYQIVGKTSTRSSPAADAGPAFNDVPTALASAEFNKIRNSQGSSLRSMPQIREKMCLRDVVIKSSYNTAYTGSYMNLDMIKQVLSRGCRFLDFQVFVKDGSVVVGYSNATFDPSFTSMTSINCLSLAGVCSTIMSSAFSDTSPNKDDPLFVQFHLKTASNYDTVANILYSNMNEKIAWNKDANQALVVSGDTRIVDIMGKVVLLIDAPLLASYTPTCTDASCYSLTSIANMITNTPTVPIYTESELTQQMYSPSSSTPYLFRIVQPTLGFFMGTSNPDAHSLIRFYGVQVIAVAFYILDSNLKAYESLFDKSQCAFLSLSSTVGTITNSQTT
jgi:hypothetical protein